MKIRRELLKRLVAFFCFFLIIAFACVIFLSHSFECVDRGCVICYTINSWRSILSAFYLCALICCAVELRPAAFRRLLLPLFIQLRTPVRLKVKLSD